MKHILAILFLLTGLISEAQQRIVIENLAAVDSAWISGGNLFYRKNGNTFNAGSVGGAAPVTSVFGRTGTVTAQSGDYASFYQPLNLKLTTFSDLSNGTGWLYNNGSGTYSWSTPFPNDSSLSINNRILASGIYTAGNGLTLSGSQFSLGGTWNNNPVTITCNDCGFTTYDPSISFSGIGALLLTNQKPSFTSQIALRADSTVFNQTDGIFSFPTLTIATDTSFNKPLTYNISTKRFEYLNGWPSGTGSGFPSDTSLSINNRILARFPSDTSLSIGNRFLGKQDALGFTPVPNTRTLTINGTTFDLTANRTWTIPTFSSDTSTSINNRILARFPSDTSLSINNRILARFPSDTSASINNRFFSYTTRSEFLDSMAAMGNITINSQFAPIATQTGADIFIHSLAHTSMSNLLTIDSAVGTYGKNYRYTINQGNFSLNSIGGTLQTSKGGVPTGGSTGQVLKKNSNSDYDYSWQADNTGSGIPADSSTLYNNRYLNSVLLSGSYADPAWLTSLAPAKLTQSGAISGQVLKWNGSAWAPGTDNTGGGGSSLTTQSVTGTGAVGDSIKLVNDAAAPGNNRVYGTNGSGTKGWQQTEVVNKTSIAAGDLLQWDNTNSEWDNVKLDSLLKKRFEYQTRVAYDYHNEFINTVGTAAPGADVVATNSGTGAATSAQTTDATNRVGLVRTTTGTTATGRSYVNTASAAIRLGGGWWKFETMVNVTALSTGTERFQLMFGFFDTYTAANQTDGVYFLYDEGGVSTGSAASANWQLVTASNSVRTFTTTSTAVSAATWVRLTVVVNADATSAQFFINGTSVGVHSANIPSGTGRELGFGWGMIKSVGTTARTIDVDYLSSQLIFTTIRQ